jgi:hypothetical protein
VSRSLNCCLRWRICTAGLGFFFLRSGEGDEARFGPDTEDADAERDEADADAETVAMVGRSSREESTQDPLTWLSRSSSSCSPLLEEASTPKTTRHWGLNRPSPNSLLAETRTR